MSFGTALLAVVACDHPATKRSTQTDGGGAGCVAGTELCACLAGNVCQADLVCGSGLCVRLGGGPGAGGASGGGGEGGGATTGAGGSSGAGQGGGSGGGGSPGGNLVGNGDFSSGETNWNVIINSGGDAAHTVRDGAWCVTVGTNQSVTLGWGNSSTPLQLTSGTGYRLSFRASASNALGSFTAKVGHALDPFTTDFQQDGVQVGNGGLQPFTYTFTTDHVDDNTGIAFIVTGPGNGTSDVCVDDVTLGVGN